MLCHTGSSIRLRDAKTLCNDLAVIALLHEHTCDDLPIDEDDIAVFERELLLDLDLRRNERDLR